MFRFAVIALLAVSASASPRRGAIRLTDKRIVGGVDAEQGEFPEQVSIHIFGSHSCGGSLVNENYVLTAGHCCDGFGASNYLVVAGEHRLNQNDGTEEERDVDTVYQHEGYDGSVLTNDICLLKLSAPIAEAAGISYVGLAADGAEPGDLEPLVVTGWGTTSEGGNLANTLQKVEVPYVPNDRCAEQYQGFNDIDETMLCAGDEENGGIDACQGDSGGPIFFVSDRTQVGLTSWGYGCARPGYPGVYARTTFFNDWIQSTMEADP